MIKDQMDSKVSEEVMSLSRRLSKRVGSLEGKSMILSVHQFVSRDEQGRVGLSVYSDDPGDFLKEDELQELIKSATTQWVDALSKDGADDYKP